MQPQVAGGTPPVVTNRDWAHFPLGKSVQSESFTQRTAASLPSHAFTPAVGSQATASLRWIVPSGQRRNPEGFPSAPRTGAPPSHAVAVPPPAPRPVVVVPAGPPPPAPAPAPLVHAVRPMAARRDPRR